MLRRIRALFFILLAATIGAVVGRIVQEMRTRQEAGEDVTGIDMKEIRVKPADLVPGLVAAVRVHDQPWSWLHVPSWMAAFVVNAAVGAVGGNLARLREMAEQSVFDMTGVDISGRERDDESLRYHVEDYDARADPHAPAPGEPWSPNTPSPESRRDPGLDEPTPGYTSLRE